MKPISLTVSDLHSYQGEHSMQFEGLRVVGISGPNGSAKSSFFSDAPLFAIFGATRAGRDSIIRHGAENARAEFVFELGGEVYRVIRQHGRKRSTLSFCRQIGDAWEPLDGASIPETQARIEKTTGLTYDLATRTVWSLQGEADRFAKDPPADRKGTLLHLLDADYWEEQAGKARRELASLAAENAALTSRHELKCMEAEEAEVARTRIAELEQEIARATESLTTAQKALQDAQETRGALQAEHVGVEARGRELARLEAAVDSTRDEMRIVQSDLQDVAKWLKGIDDLSTRISKAQAAEKTVTRQEGRRQRDEELRREAQRLESDARTAHREHKTACQALADKIDGAIREQHQKVGRAEEKVVGLAEQVKVMAQVPCADCDWCPVLPEPLHDAWEPQTDDTRDLAGTCPLLKIAREAQALLPETRELARIARDAKPWADDEKNLRALEEQKPWEAAEARLAAIPDEGMAIGYDSATHLTAKRAAAELPDLRQQQGDCAGHKATQAATQKRLDALMLELGKASEARDKAAEDPDLERNWDAEIMAATRATLDAEGAVACERTAIAELGKDRAVTEDALARAEAAGTEAEALAGQIADAKSRAHRLEILEASCGKRGLPQWIIEEALPMLQEAANGFLAELSDGRFAVSLVTQAETKKGTIIETLDVVVSDSDGPRPLETFSGGEKVRINLALRMGLTALLSQRAGVRLRMSVLDEPSDGLSDEGIDALADCLGRIGKRLDFLGVVSHDTRLRDRFDQRIVVSRDENGWSQLEVLS